jgi:hypothetical protein
MRSKKQQQLFSTKRVLTAFIVLAFLGAAYMVMLMIQHKPTPDIVKIDLVQIKESIDEKDVQSLADQHLTDQQMAEILNRNFVAEKPKKKTIAYAITVTKDGNFVDGALVLGYAARRIHDASKGFPSDYDAALVAFVTANVITSRPILEGFGWKILEKPLPVPLGEIENQEYANKMKDSGCCGADEFLKLWAYTLTDYHRVVHLDMDSILFKSMDSLYEIDREMLFTGDYNMGSKPVPPAQGGFLVIRPSLERFKEFQAIVRKGDWGDKGWGGSHIGKFWGGQTIQGIVPYFYHTIHPGDAQELNRCVYNCMVDNPYRKGTTICLDGQKTCEDCRLQKIENVVSAHFTICQKPWTCTSFTNPNNNVLCEALHRKWFELRDEFERSLNLNIDYRIINDKKKDSLGMCRGFGDEKYLPIPVNQLVDYSSHLKVF